MEIYLKLEEWLHLGKYLSENFPGVAEFIVFTGIKLANILLLCIAGLAIFVITEIVMNTVRPRSHKPSFNPKAVLVITSISFCDILTLTVFITLVLPLIVSIFNADAAMSVPCLQITLILSLLANYSILFRAGALLGDTVRKYRTLHTMCLSCLFIGLSYVFVVYVFRETDAAPNLIHYPDWFYYINNIIIFLCAFMGQHFIKTINWTLADEMQVKAPEPHRYFHEGKEISEEEFEIWKVNNGIK